jgi:formate/nitrite transporter FocA (FNT family)
MQPPDRPSRIYPDLLPPRRERNSSPIRLKYRPREDDEDREEREEQAELDVHHRSPPPGEVVYEVVYREGEHELERSSRALLWSGLAAGLSMGFSFVAEALLLSHLPDATWTPAVSKLGYSIGFLIVILGRQQLFTKNTLTVILPLLNPRGERPVRNVVRLWGVVLGANILGAIIFAILVGRTNMFPSPVREEFITIGGALAGGGVLSVVLRAILAGWLIALMIWLLPFAESARVWVIALLAYVVGLGDLPHIVAGAVPAFYNVFTGQSGFFAMLGGFAIPTFIGNAIGGVAFVAALAHAELSGTVDGELPPRLSSERQGGRLEGQERADRYQEVVADGSLLQRSATH